MAYEASKFLQYTPSFWAHCALGRRKGSMNEAISWVGRVNRHPPGGRLPFGIRIHVEHPSLLAELNFRASSILCSSIDLDVSTDHTACGLVRESLRTSLPCLIFKRHLLNFCLSVMPCPVHQVCEHAYMNSRRRCLSIRWLRGLRASAVVALGC
jgi:hypothetical protein